MLVFVFLYRLGISPYKVLELHRLMGIISLRILVVLHGPLGFLRGVLHATIGMAEFSILICFVFKRNGDTTNKANINRTKVCKPVSPHNSLFYI